MSIASEISRLQQAKSDIKTAIEGKGVEVPSSATLDTYDDYINAIVTGGGGDIPMPASATSVTLDDWARLTSVTIKSGVTSLPNNLYKQHTHLSSVTIPNTVTSIGDSVFQECSNLSSVTFAEGSQLASIGESAFTSCNGLTAITIPSGVTSIGNYAFYTCRNLVNVNIPSGVTTIGDYVFNGCYALTSITIPSGVTSIGYRAFYFCSGLTSISIPSGVTSIGNYALRKCSGLTAITVNATTPPTLGTSALDDTADAPIYVPCNSVNAYKTAWSEYASRITCDSPVPPTPPVGTYKAVLNVTGGQQTGYITIACDASSAITSAETHVGQYTLFCVDATVGDCVTTIGDKAFYSYTALRTVTIPSGVTTIGDEAFLDCLVLSSITIPDSVTSIGQAAFEACDAISSITIPSSVTSIGQTAFANNSGLTSITCLSTTPPTIGSSVFYNTNDCPIYVQSDSVNAYKAATNWSTYASRIQAIPSSPFDFPFSLNYNAKTYNAQTKTIAKTQGQLMDENAVIVGDSNSISYSNGVLSFTPNSEWDGVQPTLIEFTGNTVSYMNVNSQSPAMTIIAKIQAVDGTFDEYCIDEDQETGDCIQYEQSFNGYYMSFLAGGGYGFNLNPPTASDECLEADEETGDCTDENILANGLYLNSAYHPFNAPSNATGLATVSVVVSGNQATFKDYGTLATSTTSFAYDSYKTSHNMFYTGEQQYSSFKFAWLFMSQSALTAQQIQQVINYNENL